MRSLIRILKSIKGRHSKCCHAGYWLKFSLMDAPLLRKCEFGEGTTLHVPLRSIGQGTLVVGNANYFGFELAPRFGSGEILLQPREQDAQINIGDHKAFSNNVSLVAMGKISIGNRCLIGDQVTILDCDFHYISPDNRWKGVGPILPVVIGDNVWLGSRVMVLKGVTIGDNSVVAAMSVVTKSIPPNSLAAGNPARVIRSLP